jgi:hydroxyacyl-ACP dehydratase HTD2-like protein with hotdog domain
MADQIYFEDLNEGDAIPELKKKPSTQQLVQWAAGSGDFYQIHYDKDFAIGTGLQGIIVHGALKHAFLGDLLHRFAGPQGRVKRVACSYRGMDVPDKEYTLGGTVTKKYTEGEKHFVELEIWGQSEDGQKTTPGTGVVTLPSRG